VRARAAEAVLCGFVMALAIMPIPSFTISFSDISRKVGTTERDIDGCCSPGPKNIAIIHFPPDINTRFIRLDGSDLPRRDPLTHKNFYWEFCSRKDSSIVVVLLANNIDVWRFIQHFKRNSLAISRAGV
jgi:hypothetical protein